MECLVTDGGVSITDSIRGKRVGSIGGVLAAGAITVKRAKTGGRVFVAGGIVVERARANGRVSGCVCSYRAPRSRSPCLRCRSALVTSALTPVAVL